MDDPVDKKTRDAHPTGAVAWEVIRERVDQDRKWGEQNHPNGTGKHLRDESEWAKHMCDQAFRLGEGTWRHILAEEVAEAFAESEPSGLRAELIQVAAVAVAWVEAIDRAVTRP